MQDEIRTSGDFRKFIVDRMVDVAKGVVSHEKGMTIAAMGKVVVESMAVEIKVARAKAELKDVGAGVGELTNIGRLLIADSPQSPFDGAK